MDNLAGKVAVVTGASSGIGRAVAEQLGRAGMRVAACARRAGLIDGINPRPELTAAIDVRDVPSLVAFFARVEQELGGVDVLINNAGLGRMSPLVDGDDEAWREMLDVNVLGLCVATREAIRSMRARSVPGHVVHISSMAAHRVPPGSGVYSATKYAVRSLTESLRKELRALKSPIRVSAVSPGFVETEFAATYHGRPDAAAETYGRYPVLQASDVSQAVLWILTQPAHVQVHDLLMRPTDQPT